MHVVRKTGFFRPGFFHEPVGLRGAMVRQGPADEHDVEVAPVVVVRDVGDELEANILSFWGGVVEFTSSVVAMYCSAKSSGWSGAERYQRAPPDLVEVLRREK